MAFFDKDEIHELYEESKKEAQVWRKDYNEYERLADNGLLEDLDEFEPEVNDGSLAAALFKLPKRIVSSKLKGRAKALDADDAWITELANIQWENEIVPNANSQAPFHRKWKDAVRKSAIYGSQPIINLFVHNGTYTGSDIVIPQAQDVTLEAGKVSDYDSDVIFWDVYYSTKQVRDMIEQAEADKKNPTDGYNKWDIKELQRIIDAKQAEDRPANVEHESKKDKSVGKNGIHFYIAFQRGIEAPFYMCSSNKKVVREWSNPDPTGDIPVHYLYCYQDFVNPYGIGIVKLAGGTQNVLDYMRRADVLATQLGLRPVKLIEGNADEIDEDSLVYAQDANWFAGSAKITRLEMANGVYNQIPTRIEMYQSSLNKILPMGDTSVSAAAGDPTQSKTPAGVKFQEANLSIDDDDFKDNTYMTYEAVAKSMINTHFANMQGTDLVKLSDTKRDILAKSGIEFPLDEEGNPTNELEIRWDEARATFDFEVEAEVDKNADDEKKLEGLLKVAEFKASDPNFDITLQQSGKRMNVGELYAEIIGLTTDNDKIIEDIDPEELAGLEQQQEQAMLEQQQMGVPEEQLEQEMPVEAEEAPEDPEADIPLLMQQYGVDEATARGMNAAIDAGFTAEEVLEYVGGQNA